MLWVSRSWPRTAGPRRSLYRASLTLSTCGEDTPGAANARRQRLSHRCNPLVESDRRDSRTTLDTGMHEEKIADPRVMAAPRVATIFVYALAAGLVVLAAALLAVASIPFATLKPQLEALTLHGHADVFTEAFHQRVAGILRAGSVVPLVGAAAVLVFRRRIARMAGDAAGSVSSFLAVLAGEAAGALRSDGRLHLSLLGAVLLLGLGIRLLFLFQPMRYDESYTYTHFASTPLYLTVSNYSSTNNHILNTLLMQLSTLVFGNHPWALRLPAFVAGWLLVPATYVVTRMFFNKHAGLLAGALVAASSALVLFSTNARGYTLMTLSFLLILALAPYCLRSSRAGPWILFSIITALGFYALPTMLYGFGIAAGWILLSTLVGEAGAARWAAAGRLVAASVGGGALTIVLYGPVLMVFGTNMRNTDVLPQTWQKVASEMPAVVMSAWRQWNVALPVWVAALLILGFVAALVFHSRVSPYRFPLALVAVPWIAAVILIQRVVPYDRVWIFLLPLYLALAAVGLAYLWCSLMLRSVGRREEAFGLVALAVGVALAWNVAATQSVYYADDTGTLRDGEAIAAWMKDHLGTGDIVLTVTPGDGILEYYFPVFGLRPADYWYSTQIRGRYIEPGRRLLAVVRDSGPDLPAMLKRAGLAPNGLSSPELVRRFHEAGIYQMVGIQAGG